MKKLLLILFAFTLAGNVAWGQGLEDFTNSNATGSYADNNFVGQNGITWYYVQSRNANGDANGSGITLPALMLRRSSSNSKVYSGTISGGIGNFSVKLYKGFTGAGNRQVELFINDVSYGTSTAFDDYNEHVFTVNNINVSGNIVIRIDDITSKQVIVDDISWTGYTSSGPDDPANLTASAGGSHNGTDEMDLSWDKNAAGDNVMVAYNTTNTFGTPSDGTTYAVGADLGGATVIYNGSATTYHHTGLTANTHYYYKAWSVDGSTNYSSGVTTDATTSKAEPTNQVNNFAVGTPASTSIPLTWGDNDGAVVADGYLLMVNTSGTFTDPQDGTPQNDDTDVSDGSGVVNVGHGVGAYTWTGLSSDTHYHFKIYSYTNSGSAIDYKTDGAPTADALTTAATPTNTDLIISEVADPKDVAKAKFVEIYNAGSSTVDFGSETWYLSRQANGGSWADVPLSGTLDAGKTLTVAYNTSSFSDSYGFSANISSGNISGNGNDGYFLYHGGNHSSGTLIDAYGVIGEDGTGKPWEYTDSHAVRLPTVTGPNATWTSSEWVITGANVANMTPSVYKAAFTWAGGTSADWGNKANWTVGGSTAVSIPDVSCTVTIPSGTTNSCSVTGTPDFESDAYSVTIDNGASLDIPAGTALTIGNLTNNGTLTVKSSDASGNGSLIVHGTATGDITVQRYVAKFSSPSSPDGWHEIGCPVTSFSVSGTDWDPTHTGTKNDLYYWDESQNLWKNYRDGSFNFSPQKGYLVANDANLTHNFTGVPNTADVSISNLSKTAGQGNGWHLLGNPYPSAISWNNGNSWNLNNVGGTAEIWDEANATYAPVDAGDIIPSTNGFFVQVSTGTGSLNIPADARTHDATNNFKEVAATPKETLTFKITDDANSYSDESILGFKPNATEDWDMAFDAHKLMSLVKTAPQIWTVSKDQKFLVNYLPETTTAYDVPLHFKPGVSTVYHLTIKGADSFDNTGLVLEDLKTGEKIDLSNTGSYDFSANKGDDVNRFVLHINGVTAVPNVNETDGIQVFSYGNTVYLHGQHMLNGKVSIFNTLGQKVYDGLLNGAAKQQIRVNQHKGIYFVRVEENNHVFTKKVFIQ